MPNQAGLVIKKFRLNVFANQKIVDLMHADGSLF